jgi:hypothetical protein
MLKWDMERGDISVNSADFFRRFLSVLPLLREVECMIFSSHNEALPYSQFQVSNIVLFRV